VKSEAISYQKTTFTGSTNINFIRYFPLLRNSTASTPPAGADKARSGLAVPLAGFVMATPQESRNI
jgi:hypothetical protein